MRDEFALMLSRARKAAKSYPPELNPKDQCYARRNAAPGCHPFIRGRARARASHNYSARCNYGRVVSGINSKEIVPPRERRIVLFVHEFRAVPFASANPARSSRRVLYGSGSQIRPTSAVRRNAMRRRVRSRRVAACCDPGHPLDPYPLARNPKTTEASSCAAELPVDILSKVFA